MRTIAEVTVVVGLVEIVELSVPAALLLLLLKWVEEKGHVSM